jgi:hypothetical protein
MVPYLWEWVNGRKHFIGAPAVWSFGPILLFISGTGYGCHFTAAHRTGKRKLNRRVFDATARRSREYGRSS